MFFDVFLEIFWRGRLVSFYQALLQVQNWLSNFSRLWWSLTSWEFWWFGIYNHPWTRMEQCMFEICMIPQGFFLNRRFKWGPLQLTGNACFRKPYLRGPAKTYNEWLLFQGFPGWRNVLMILVRVYYGMIWISLCMSLRVGSFWYVVMLVARIWLQPESTKVIIKHGHVEYWKLTYFLGG